MDQTEWRGVRADDEPGNDIAEYNRLPEAMEQNGHHTGHQHDHCQILNKIDGMHGGEAPCDDDVASRYRRALRATAILFVIKIR